MGVSVAHVVSALKSVAEDIAEAYNVDVPHIGVSDGGKVRRGDKVRFIPVPGSKSCSSGVTTIHADGTKADIIIQIGTDPLDVLLVMLHEMAHIIVPPRTDSRGHVIAHTKQFYETAGELYAIYKIPLSYALWRECFSGHHAAAQTIAAIYADAGMVA